MDEKLTKGRKNNIEIRPLSAPILDEPRKLKKKTGYLQQNLASIVVSLLPCIFGAAVGWASPTLIKLQSASSPIGEQLNDREVSILGSLVFLGGIFGMLFWSRIADNFGRKITGYSIGIVFVIGWGIIEFTSNKYALFIARFITGVSGVGSLMLCSLYISEIADDEIRGTLGSYSILFMNIGTVGSYCFGAIFSYRILTGICLAMPLIFLVLFIWLPETPVHLWRKGKKSAAENSLHWLKGGNFTKVQEEIIKFSNLEGSEKSVSYLTLFSTRANRMGMLLGLGIFAGQQFCGILALLTYVTKIFQDSGSSINSDLSAIIVGLFQLIASAVSTLLVEKCGRKILLLISFMLMGLTLTVLGIFFFMKTNTSVETANFAWLPVVMLCTYVIGYSLGVGPLPYVVITESLCPEIRALATSVILFWGTSLTFICVLIFPYLVSSIGVYGNFWFFAVFSYLGFIFTLLIVPETKSIPLSEILAKLSGK